MILLRLRFILLSGADIEKSSQLRFDWLTKLHGFLAEVAQSHFAERPSILQNIYFTV